LTRAIGGVKLACTQTILRAALCARASPLPEEVAAMASRPSNFSRREFLASSAAASTAGALSGGLFQALVARAALASPAELGRCEGYGPLRAAGEELALPSGFQYAVLSTEGDPMDDGFPVPKAMDGMAAFPLANGNVLLIRNHEDSETGARLRPRPPGSTSSTAGILNGILNTHYGPRDFAYDTYAGGGTVSLEVEPRGRRRRVSEHWSLVGTLRNCAGGPTPWGSWLSCEETLEAPSPTGYAQDHGYVFEVPVVTSPGSPAAAVPLKRLGRFAHEAVAVDPATGIVYETEDQGDTSGFYRFVPDVKPTQPGQLGPGRLEMMRLGGMVNYEAAIGQTPGVALPVDWVPVANPDPTPHTVVVGGVTMSAVYYQGLGAGGAIFRRLEGCWYSEGKIYFVSTNGGNMGFGQVWVYDPRAETVKLIFESPGVDVLDGPDNIAVSPRGGLILCEDAGSAQYLRGISTSGQIFDFARNLHSSVEFAGTCFAPDGKTLFVNIYGRSTVRTTAPYKSLVQIPVGPEKRERAITLAIWGPWGSGPL
jgi:secreted PhoX family phosphatase